MHDTKTAIRGSAIQVFGPRVMMMNRYLKYYYAVEELKYFFTEGKVSMYCRSGLRKAVGHDIGVSWTKS